MIRSCMRHTSRIALVLLVAAGSLAAQADWRDVFSSEDEKAASSGGDSVLRYDGETGEFLGDFVASRSGGMDGPHLMTFVPRHQVEIKAGSASALGRSWSARDGGRGATPTSANSKRSQHASSVPGPGSAGG